MSKIGFNVERTEDYVNTPWDEHTMDAGILVAGVVYVLISPLILIKKITEKLKEKRIRKSVKTWSSIATHGNYQLYWKGVDDKQLLKDLNYPKETKYLNACELRAEPGISELENKYFHLSAASTGDGIFLLSFHNYEDGMTVWFLHQSGELKDVCKVESYDWQVETMDEHSVKLYAEAYKAQATYKTAFTYVIEQEKLP